MLQIQYFAPAHPAESAQGPLVIHPHHQSPPRRLRHYIVGCREDTQHAIDRLHLLGYLDRIAWSQVVDLPENGFVIYPRPGEVLRYTQRDRPGT